MKREVVREIQRTLKALGINPGPIDGDYDHMTAAAVAAFQATKGLVVDGQVGPQTSRRLKIELS